MEMGTVFDIQRFSIKDGPGIRTTVFLKGCPLRCLWCDNPESQTAFSQLFHFKSLCVKCYRCVEVCPEGATRITEDGSIEIARELCKACGRCIERCLSGARAISGKMMSVEEVVDIVKKDELFYRNSNGGVTVSGGEPTSQPDFLVELFRRCHECGFHTTLDTCGYVVWETLERVLENTDLVLFDIKHVDSERHQQLTGVGNELILENARRTAQQKPMIIRIPLIPGLNDSMENIEALAEFAESNGISRIDLLPYHKLGAGKYERLGQEYKLDDVLSYKEEDLDFFINILKSHRREVSVG